MVKPGFGAARIATNTDGTYRPDPAGEYAAVLGVHDRDGELVDLCAWRVDAPGHWWLRYGDECFFLGARALEVAAYFNDPIAVHGAPQDWALSSGEGACVLRWDVDLRPWFEGIKRVDCHSAVAARLRQNFRTWEPATVRRRHAA